MPNQAQLLNQVPADHVHPHGAYSFEVVLHLGGMLARVKGQIVTKRLDRVSPLAVPALLEISKEMVAGEAHEDLMHEAEEELVKEAMRIE